MKNILLLILFTSGIYAQSIHHQMLSSQGTSKILNNGMMISQTIGQQSAIGNHTNGVTVGQGFQQSHWAKYVTVILSIKFQPPLFQIHLLQLSIFNFRNLF